MENQQFISHPNPEEKFGGLYDGGKLIRKARKPILNNNEDHHNPIIS